MIQTSSKFLAQLKHLATTQSSKECIIETATGRYITNRDFWHAVEIFRNYLGTPQTILVALPGGILDSIIWLSTLLGGHLLIPISPQSTLAEFTDAKSRHNPALILSDMPFSTSTKHLSSQDCQRIIDTYVPSQTHIPPQDGSLYLSTSGSTGQPKGILLSLKMILITAHNIATIHELSASDRGLTPLPFYHVNAPIVSLIASLLTGGTVIIAPKFSVHNFWSWVRNFSPTWISIVPTIVAMLLTTDKPEFLDSVPIRFVRTASSPLPATNLTAFEKKFGIPVIETYGISEAASTIAANPLPPREHKPGSVGLPLNIEMMIATFDTQSNQLTPLRQGERGEICVRGDNVISQYEQEAKKEAFQNGWFRTGDIGYFDDDGYLFITGRIKDIIIRGGENIFPREIEEVFLTHPEIHDVSVVGRPDPIYGEEIVAFLVTKGNKKLDETQLKEFAKPQLSSPKIPVQFYFLPALPKGRTGKIDKNALRALVQNA